MGNVNEGIPEGDTEGTALGEVVVGIDEGEHVGSSEVGYNEGD